MARAGKHWSDRTNTRLSVVPDFFSNRILPSQQIHSSSCGLKLIMMLSFCPKRKSVKHREWRLSPAQYNDPGGSTGQLEPPIRLGAQPAVFLKSRIAKYVSFTMILFPPVELPVGIADWLGQKVLSEQGMLPPLGVAVIERPVRGGDMSSLSLFLSTLATVDNLTTEDLSLEADRVTAGSLLSSSSIDMSRSSSWRLAESLPPSSSCFSSSCRCSSQIDEEPAITTRFSPG